MENIPWGPVKKCGLYKQLPTWDPFRVKCLFTYHISLCHFPGRLKLVSLEHGPKLTVLSVKHPNPLCHWTDFISRSWLPISRSWDRISRSWDKYFEKKCWLTWFTVAELGHTTFFFTIFISRSRDPISGFPDHISGSRDRNSGSRDHPVEILRSSSLVLDIWTSYVELCQDLEIISQDREIVKLLPEDLEILRRLSPDLDILSRDFEMIISRSWLPIARSWDSISSSRLPISRSWLPISRSWDKYFEKKRKLDILIQPPLVTVPPGLFFFSFRHYPPPVLYHTNTPLGLWGRHDAK